MRALLLPKSNGTVKPPPAAEMMKGHPLCPDFCVLVNEGGGITLYDRNRGIPGSFVGNVRRDGSYPGYFSGECIEYTAADTATRVNFGNAENILPTGEVTFIIRYRKTDATQRSAMAFGNIDPNNILAGSDSCEILIAFASNTTYFDWGGATEGTSRLSGALNPYGDNVFAFVSSNRHSVMEIWKDGVKKLNNAGGVVRATNSAQNFHLGGSPFRGSDLAQTLYFFMYKRRLTAGEIVEISFNPYCFIAPPQPKRLLVKSAAAPAGQARSFGYVF